MGKQTLQIMGSSGRPAVDERSPYVEELPNIDGVIVREEDIEPVKGLRTIAVIFRGLSIILLVLMALQAFFAATSAVSLSAGVVVADAVRLIIFAGLLWGAGDLAVLFVKSHYDLRATRILMARVAHALDKRGESNDAVGRGR
jgi:hypothetical protein